MLKGNSINLRLMENEDLDEFHRLYNDIENRGDYYYLGLEPENVIKKRYNDDGYWSENFGRMLIVDKDDDSILGYIVYFKSVPWFSSYEIGYRLFETSNRKKGMMSEALKLFMGYIFDSKSNINRLEIRTHPKNIASQKVAKKNGFIEEGDARGAHFYKTEFIDIKQFSITRAEYYSKKE